MQMKQTALVLGLLLAVFSAAAYADESGADGSVYTVSFFTIQPGQLDAYLAGRAEIQALIRKNEFIKSRRVYRHAWGPEWSVMVVTEYGSLADIDRASARTQELYREAYPDKDERDARRARMGAMRVGHTDAIVRAVPALAK